MLLLLRHVQDFKYGAILVGGAFLMDEWIEGGWMDRGRVDGLLWSSDSIVKCN